MCPTPHTQNQTLNTVLQWRNQSHFICITLISKENGKLYHLKPDLPDGLPSEGCRESGGIGMWKCWWERLNWMMLELGYYGKGLQHWIFLDSGPLTSESVPLFRFQSCPSPLVLPGGVRLWFLVQLEDTGGTCTVLSLQNNSRVVLISLICCDRAECFKLVM